MSARSRNSTLRGSSTASPLPQATPWAAFQVLVREKDHLLWTACLASRDATAAVSAAWPVDATDAETSGHVEHLLRAPETAETVAALGDAACAASVRALTLRVCSELQGGDAVSNALAQRQLAQ